MIRSTRPLLVSLVLLSVVAPVSGQVEEVVPEDLARIELDRSRRCVGVLARVQRLDQALAPFAERSRRLTRLAEAIALEDASIVEPFDRSDAVEAMVADWFVTDAALAQRYLNQPDRNLAAERAAGRESVKTSVNTAVADLQEQANAMMDADEGLAAESAPCEGAIFVRSAVLEACETEDGPICEQAARPASEAVGFRFVETPENLWDIQQLRPWTAPTGLRPGANGQLDGARTIGFARVGNVVVSVAFAPLLRQRSEIQPADLARFSAVNDSLGLTFDHPDLAFVPALGVRATLPAPLAGEDAYVLHFAEGAEVLWSGQAGTGGILEATVPIAAANAQRLRAGEALVFTAVRDAAADVAEPAYTIALSNVNQAQAVDGLLGYMASQLSADLAVLVRAGGGM